MGSGEWEENSQSSPKHQKNPNTTITSIRELTGLNEFKIVIGNKTRTSANSQLLIKSNPIKIIRGIGCHFQLITHTKTSPPSPHLPISSLHVAESQLSPPTLSNYSEFGIKRVDSLKICPISTELRRNT